MALRRDLTMAALLQKIEAKADYTAYWGLGTEDEGGEGSDGENQFSWGSDVEEREGTDCSAWSVDELAGAETERYEDVEGVEVDSGLESEVLGGKMDQDESGGEEVQMLLPTNSVAEYPYGFPSSGHLVAWRQRPWQGEWAFIAQQRDAGDLKRLMVNGRSWF